MNNNLDLFKIQIRKENGLENINYFLSLKILSKGTDEIKAGIVNISFLDKECYFDNPDTYFFDYWKNILLSICKHYKCSMVRNKSIQYLIDTLKSGNNITLSINLTCRLKNNVVKICITK